MDDKLFKELDANLKEAVKVAKGIKAPKSVYVVLKPAEIKAIRTRVGMSQSVFESTFRLSLDTLKGWEQGKEPGGKRQAEAGIHSHSTSPWRRDRGEVRHFVRRNADQFNSSGSGPLLPSHFLQRHPGQFQ